VVLPSPDSLSLSEAVALLRVRCDCSENEAKNALRQAGLDGCLEAEGAIPLSVHPDPKFREKHGVPTREARWCAALLLTPRGVKHAGADITRR
jgi:hypothetical protein